MRSLVKILVLASALLGLTGTALSADVSPSIEVRLVSPFVAVSAGAPMKVVWRSHPRKSAPCPNSP